MVEKQLHRRDSRGERSLASIGRELEERFAAAVRHKKINRTIKDFVIYAFRHKPICERALRSIGRVFGDRAAVVCYEQITFAVKGLVPGVSVDGNQYCCQSGHCQGDK